jgi:hypothetical protein
MAKVLQGFFRDCDARFVDAALPTSVSGAGGQGPAHRQLICSYSGRNFVVEREGDELNVYLVSAARLPLSMTGDSLGGRKPMTAARLQEINEAARKRVGDR